MLSSGLWDSKKALLSLRELDVSYLDAAEMHLPNHCRSSSGKYSGSDVTDNLFLSQTEHCVMPPSESSPFTVTHIPVFSLHVGVYAF